MLYLQIKPFPKLKPFLKLITSGFKSKTVQKGFILTQWLKTLDNNLQLYSYSWLIGPPSVSVTSRSNSFIQSFENPKDNTKKEYQKLRLFLDFKIESLPVSTRLVEIQNNYYITLLQ